MTDKFRISLAAARVNANMTQEQVAKLMRKNKQTIVIWEKGKTGIDCANLLRLCEIYKIQNDYIFCLLNQVKVD